MKSKSINQDIKEYLFCADYNGVYSITVFNPSILHVLDIANAANDHRKPFYGIIETTEDIVEGLMSMDSIERLKLIKTTQYKFPVGKKKQFERRINALPLSKEVSDVMAL